MPNLLRDLPFLCLSFSTKHGAVVLNLWKTPLKNTPYHHQVSALLYYNFSLWFQVSSGTEDRSTPFCHVHLSAFLSLLQSQTPMENWTPLLPLPFAPASSWKEQTVCHEQAGRYIFVWFASMHISRSWGMCLLCRIACATLLGTTFGWQINPYLGCSVSTPYSSRALICCPTAGWFMSLSNTAWTAIFTIKYTIYATFLGAYFSRWA